MTTPRDERAARFAHAVADRYTVERELGRGGAATVYLAVDRKHDRRVALKMLNPELSAAVGGRRFLAEIRLLARLNHPHILPLYDSGEAAGMLYYVMPYVEGESLRDRLERERQLPVADALRIARQVAEALAYAHAQNVVHRDIKPENILLAPTHAAVADFGVARAISRAAGERSTAAGVVLGTPAYMSPEQASGDQVIDGRSDVYTLGCVLYEMLAGASPFTGPTPQAIIARRFLGPPPRLRSVRPAVSSRVESAVSKALEVLPADRFATAAEFAAALEAAESGTRTRWRWWWGGAAALAAALVGAAGAFAARDRMGRHPALDRSLYAVVPFGHAGASAPRLVDGDQCEQLLYDAFSRWADLRVLNAMQVGDAQRRRGITAPLSLGQALDVARSLGAGMLAWGEVREFNGRVYVRGALYDVTRGGRRLREHQVEVAPSLADAREKFNELADSLIVGGEPSAALSGAMGTRLVQAWRAYARGHVALRDWDLSGAEEAFRAAATADPGYAHAHLWLAQTLDWARETEDERWRAAATRAFALGDRLPPYERALARGQLLLARAKFPQACETYRALVQRDTNDFAAWYGLGECHGSDPVVVPDRASPSGWRFRGSGRAAVNAYLRALDVMPSFHLALRGGAFARLPALLSIEQHVTRSGYTVRGESDTLWFEAFPALDHDTLAYTPYPRRDVYAGRPGTIPPTAAAAVDRNRTLLKAITTNWVRTFPASAAAQEELATVLETRGEIAEAEPGEWSALTSVRRARLASRDAMQQLRLAATEIRLLVKLERFTAAREAADSLLRATPEPGAAEAAQLAGVAALTGRVHETAHLLARSAPGEWFYEPDGTEVRVPPPLSEAALALLGYAALGAPRDSLLAGTRRIDKLVASYVEPRRRLAVRRALFDTPLALAFPELGAAAFADGDPGLDYLRPMQLALTRGDTAAVRRRLAALREQRRGFRPADLAIDGTYHEGLLLLATGDTTTAVESLDASLNALPALSAALLRQVPQAAALPRAMALRAELAARAGDAATAQRWAQAVVTLWANADPELGPTVRRMRALLPAPGGR